MSLWDELTPAQREAALSYRGPENIGKKMTDDVDRIREANRKAYFQFKSRAEFMCLDTSTWKDPEMTDMDKIVQDLKDTQWKMADEIEKLRSEEHIIAEANRILRSKMEGISGLWDATKEDWNLILEVSLTEPTCPVSTILSENTPSRKYAYISDGPISCMLRSIDAVKYDLDNGML